MKANAWVPQIRQALIDQPCGGKKGERG